MNCFNSSIEDSMAERRDSTLVSAVGSIKLYNDCIILAALSSLAFKEVSNQQRFRPSDEFSTFKII